MAKNLATVGDVFDPVEAMCDLLGLEFLDPEELKAYAFSIETDLGEWTSQTVIDHFDRFAAGREASLATVAPQSIEPEAMSDAADFDPAALLDELREGRDRYINRVVAQAEAIVGETPALLECRLGGVARSANFRQTGQRFADRIYGSPSSV